MEFKNEISFFISVKNNEERKAWQLQSEFFRATRLDPDNIYMHESIGMYDWFDPLSPVKYSCMRLKLRSGQGFVPIPDKKDVEVKHYRIDLDLYYK